MLKLLTWPLWLPFYVMSELDVMVNGSRPKHRGWTIEDSRVFFRQPYGDRNFYDRSNPFADEEQDWDETDLKW